MIKKRKQLLLSLSILMMVFGMMLDSSNYQFNVELIEAGDEVPLGPVDFSSPAADTYQYIDATQTTTYGTITNDPPSGMGADDTDDTELLEAGYSATTYPQLEYSSFGSLPSGWTKGHFTITNNWAVADETTYDRYLSTDEYDLSTYTGAKIIYRHMEWDVGYSGDDYEILYYDGSWHWLADVGAPEPYGWKTNEHSVSSTYSAFKFIITSTPDVAANKRIITDDWYIYGILSETYYRFDAIFRFDSVTLALSSYVIYIDFYSALSGSEDLDFYIGTTTNPTNLVAVDKQNDFTVIVTDYITSGSIYLKISDNYRTGDTSQSTAYIQRIYLFSPEAGWFDEEWPRRQLVTVSGATGAGTDYQVELTVPYDSNMKSDFGDLRVTDNDGITPLAYWIEEYTASTSATVWVKVDDSLESENTFYMYYGNSAASSTSNGYNTFLLFDDFNDASINTTTWDTETGSPAESGGYLILTGGTERVYSKTEWSIPVAMVARSYFDDMRTVGFCADTALVIDQLHSAFWGHLVSDSDGNTYVREDANTEKDYYAMSDNTWYNLGINWYSDSHVEFFVDGIERGDTVDTAVISSVAEYPQRVWFYVYASDVENLQVDWVYVRKIVETEPTLSSYGDEEVGDFSAPFIASVSHSPSNPTTGTGLTLFAIVTDIVGVDDVWFDAIAYPDGFEDVPYHAEEIGTNTWAYSFTDLSDGVYCFVTYAIDSVNDPTVAAYTMYQTIQVSVAQSTGYIRIFDTLGSWIPFETFEVYRDGNRQYTDAFSITDDVSYHISVYDRWGELLNATQFDAGTEEFVVVVDVYSLKFMSWYDGFCKVNLTHSGVTYQEVIMPMEVIEFMLFNGTYTYTIDYLNGTSSADYNINLTNSTGIIITGNTISDIMAMTDQLWDLVYEVNVTITATNNYVLTLTVSLDNINTTIGTQLIQILLDIDNNNSTIYDQTVDLLAAVQNTNTTIYSQLASFIVSVYNNQTAIYDQTVTLLANIANIDSDIVAQTITLLTSIENVNSTLYSQTVTMLADISNLDSDIAAQTIELLAEIDNVNSTIYSQTVYLLANITNLGSNITAQTVTLLASIENVNSTLYSQTVTMLAEISNLGSDITTQTVTLLASISNVNSTIYAQTVSLLAEISNLDSDIVAQTITLLASIENVNSTIYAQTVILLANIQNVNSTLYYQTVSVLTDIANLDSDVAAQTVTLLTSIQNVNSTLYSQTVTVLASIANIDSDIVAQTVTLLASIENVNSTLYSQTLSLVADIANMNSTIYSQTITILSQISNVNSTLYNQTISILSYIANHNVTMYQQVISILNTISNQGSTIDAQFISVVNSIEHIPVSRGITAAQMAELLGIPETDDDGDGVPDAGLADVIASQQLPYQVVVVVLLLVMIAVVIKVVRDIMPGIVKMITNGRNLGLQT